MRYWVVLVAAITASQPAFALSDAEITQRCSVVDSRTGKSYIPEKNEWALARLLTDPILAMNTKGCHAEMTAAERAAYQETLNFNAKIRLSAIQDIKRFARARTDTPYISTADLDEAFEIVPEAKGPPLIVRDAYSIPSLSKLLAAKNTADGASFTYTRGFQNDNELTALTGSVYLVDQIFPQPKDAAKIAPFDYIRWAQGIEFDQQRNRSNPQKNIDYLSPRMFAELGLPTDGSFRHLFHVGGYYNTDSRGESKVWGGFAEWQPVSNVYGISTGKRIYRNAPLAYRFDPILHVEAESVVDAGNLTKVSDGDRYMRAGAILQAHFWFLDGPPELQRLTFSGQFRHLWGTADSGTERDMQYWQASVAYNIDDRGHAAIKATYRHGDLPGTGQDVRDFKTGLSVKF